MTHGLAAHAVTPERLELRDVHLSGKFSAPTQAMIKALDWLESRADRIRLTEVSPGKWRKVLKKWARRHRWHVYHPHGRGRNECAILSRFMITGRAAYKSTSLRLKFGRTAETWVIAARTKGWGWAPVLHTPAHTGGLKRYGKFSWPTRVYFSILGNLGKIQMKLGKWIAWSADFNLHLLLDKNRKVVEDALPGMTLCTAPHQDPTEGDRVIDGEATNRDFKPSETLHGMDGQEDLDHKPVRTKLLKAA